MSTVRIMCHDRTTQHDSSPQMKFASEESCQFTNFKMKYKLQCQNPLEDNRASLS